MRKGLFGNLAQILFYKKIMIIASALITALLLSTCQTLNMVLQEPLVSFHSAEITKIDFTGAEFLCKIQVDNPNPITIPFPEVGWELFLNANSFISGVFKNNQSIRARETTIVNVPVRLNYADVFNTFRSLIGSRQTAYKIALDTKFYLPFIGAKVWHFEYGGELPMLQLPKLSMPSMKIDSMDLTKAEILVTVNVENPNVFQLPPPKIAYEYMVNRSSFIKSSVETARPLAASSVTPVSIRFSVNYADLYRSIQSLPNLSEVPSLLQLITDFGVPALNSETFRLEIPGSLPLLRF